MKRWLFLFAAAFVPAAHAQFQLLIVNGAAEVAAPAVFDLGTAAPAESASALFRLRNVSTAPASVYVLSLAGSGFALVRPPAVPQTLNAGDALDFTIQFQAEAAGSYSAGLTLPGISVILTATVLPALTWRVPTTVDFGQVPRGVGSFLQFAIENHAPGALTVPPLTVYGAGFALAGPSPAGVQLQPLQSVTFQIGFVPTTSGAFSGTLVAGDRTFALAGIGFVPQPPKPQLQIDLPPPGQQGTAHVTLDVPAPSAGTGTLTLDFQGPADPTIAFASGGRSISFPVAAGDTHAIDAPFQAGTTAGTLVFTATFGAATAQQTLAIAVAPIVISSAAAARTGAGLTLHFTGIDNTRTAGPLAFTFFDAAGAVIPPGAIAATADFASYFQTSGLGGVFLLNAAFPVTGDSTHIAAFEAQLTNAAGIVKTPRTSF